MEISISGQLLEAALALGMGLAGGFYYDILRVIRRRAQKGIVTILLDILFWLVCGIALVMFGLTIGGGEQRIFVVILAFLGGWLYFATLSKYALLLCESILEVFRFIFLILTAPFLILWRYTKKLIFFIKNVFSYLKKWCTIKNYRSVLVSLFPEEVFTNEAEESRSYNQDRGSNTGGLRRRKTHKRPLRDRRGKGHSERA